MGCGPPVVPTQDQTRAHTAKFYAVACMDFRLVDGTVRYMDSIGLNNNYDHFVVAGSSLGFTQSTLPGGTPSSIISVLTPPPSVSVCVSLCREVIFIDHRDCGAFKKFYPEITPETEEE